MLNRIYSMTGYGLGQVEKEGDEVKVEIKSVNSRFLDVNIRMPRIFLALELDLKKRLQERVNRGKIDIFINIRASKFLERELVIDYSMIEQFTSLLEDDRLALNTSLSLKDLLDIEGALVFREEKSPVLQEMLLEAFDQALEALLASRVREGQGIKGDLIELLFNLEQVVDDIASKSSQWKEIYRQSFKRRLEELLEDKSVIDQNRLEFELALFSEKKDIEEEISRSLTHIKAFKEDIDQEGPHGRKLDFLVQELGREINTMGSKAAEYELTKHVIEAKTILEQIREQLQNLE